ncbi:MAG: response regulator [Pseudomonadota bacterium]
MHNMFEKPHILVVDDDTRLRELLQTYLRDQNFAVTVAINAKDARSKLALFQFDLMVLDVMMPLENGIDFTKSLKNNNTLPILLLTAMTESEDRINGLESGADDYLVKPFEPRELVLRIKAILRRYLISEQRKNIIIFGEYQFDIAAGRLQKNDEIVSLTNSELQLLKAMIERSPEPVSRSDLAKILGIGDNERNIDVQITRLRKKIEPDGTRPQYIQTMRGSGYALYIDR